METEKQIETFCADIARDSWKSMNHAYREYLQVNSDLNPESDNGEFMDCEINLYVYKDGNWTIDNCQYLQDHRDIVAAIPLQHFESADELKEQIYSEYQD